MKYTLVQRLQALFLCCIANTAVAGTAQESWSDPNFAFCEGMGASASGRVNAYAEYTVDGTTVTITSLSFKTSGHGFDHIATGRVNYTDNTGALRTILMQHPWFDVIGVNGTGDVLYLPKNQTSSRGPGPWEQMTIQVYEKTPLEISLTLLFSADGGNCPTTFSASWQLP